MSRVTPQAFIADLQDRLGELLRNSPAGDLERNLRATLGQTFQRLDLVTRDEFDVQLERLARLQERVAQLEEALAQRERAEQEAALRQRAVDEGPLAQLDPEV
jgi:BMFP domain-containing protein YqiC